MPKTDRIAPFDKALNTMVTKLMFAQVDALSKVNHLSTRSEWVRQALAKQIRAEIAGMTDEERAELEAVLSNTAIAIKFDDLIKQDTTG